MDSETDSNRTKPLSTGSRINELDGVRGLAALLVVYQHLFLTFIPSSPSWIFWLRTGSGMAWTGVHLFFALSGFLIGSILMENREARNFFGVFYIRRALRILPLYFLLITGFFLFITLFPVALQNQQKSSIAPWSYFCLLQNFPMATSGTWGFPPLGITWSVAIEEQFYLFLPLIIWIVPERRQLLCFISLALFGPVFRALAHVAYAPFLMPGALDSLLLGTIIAWTWRNRIHFFRSRLFTRIALAVFVCTSFAMVLIACKRDFGPFRETLIALFWGSFLALVIANLPHRLCGLFRSPFLVYVGRISYGVYLIHPVVAFVLTFTLAQAFGISGEKHFSLAVASLALVLLIAHLLFKHFESPLISQGRKFHYIFEPNAPAQTENVTTA